MRNYLKPAPRHAVLWWGLLAASIMAAVWSGNELYRQYQHLLIQERSLAALHRALHPRPQAKPSRAELDAQRQWGALRQELSFSWYPIFAALEHATSSDIALLEFLPDTATGRLTLRGTARDMEALTAYLAALEAESTFHNVYLSHQKKTIQANVEVISFEIRMQL